jgi:Flp pilus assembly protein TadG
VGGGLFTLSAQTRGSISIEAVLIIPAFLLFLALIIALGRVAAAEADIHAAVVEGSRVASLEKNSSTGETAARAAITDHLAREGVRCTTLSVTVDATALDQPPGVPGRVTARVSCVVPLSDLGVPGLPGSVTITESFATHIDTYTNR